MKKIRFGIIGIGTISHRFMKGLGYVKHASVVAVASRSMQRAQDYAKTYKIAYAYGSYEDMLQNEEVDAIYIATPNDTHYEYMMMALAHGKHVLCEKPFTVHTSQTQEVFAFAKEKKLLVMDAMKACFLPTTRQVKQWLEEGSIGRLRYIEAGYCHYAQDIPETHHIYDKQRGGGSFYDVGIYPLAFVNELQQSRIHHYTYEKSYDHEIDCFSQVLIHYEDGVVASVRSSIFADMDNTAILYGDKGTIRVPQFWKSERAFLQVHGESELMFEELHHASEFRYQIEHFVDLIMEHKTMSNVMNAQATLRNMQILEGVIFD